MSESPAPHRRRIRYKGTHPRRFQEKYKELQPERFASELEKVKARGQTPAGMHRSIMVDEILRVLAPRPGERALDATLGFGGHARAILEKLLPGGHLTGLDVDPLELPRTEQRMRDLGFGEDVFAARRLNFAALPGLIPQTGSFDCILADLGLSSMQIDNPERGFTYKWDGPLDLRLNPNKGKPASELLARLSQEDLALLLEENSDEVHAALISRALKTTSDTLESTKAFANCIRQCLVEECLIDLKLEEDKAELRKILQRCFQALRIAVNDEFGVLEQFLQYLPRALKPGGRVVVLTFHSGEDRRVKKAFLEGLRQGQYCAIADVPERPSSQERFENPRSAPTKLRWAVRA